MGYEPTIAKSDRSGIATIYLQAPWYTTRILFDGDGPRTYSPRGVVRQPREEQERLLRERFPHVRLVPEPEFWAEYERRRTAARR